MKRLSSALIESLNRKPKDTKWLSRGYRNFSHMRNRLLFAQRHNPPILGIPKTSEEIRNHTGIKRGPYNKTSTVTLVTNGSSVYATVDVISDNAVK